MMTGVILLSFYLVSTSVVLFGSLLLPDLHGTLFFFPTENSLTLDEDVMTEINRTYPQYR